MPEPQPATPYPAWAKMVVALLVLGFGIWVIAPYDTRALLQDVLDWIAALGVWAPILFILIYVVATVFLIPGSALTLGAGALFGVAKGSLIALLGATLGATAAFLVGRYFARGWVAGKIEHHRSFVAIDQAVAREGWKIVGLTRLSPLFPFTFLNYAFGVTRVSLRDYFFASLLGMIPGTVMYVYLGALAKAGIQNDGRTPVQWVLLMVGLLATIGVSVFVTRVARKALGKRIESD